MPLPWTFELPTRVHFGRGEIRRLGEQAAGWGTSVLLVGYADQTGLAEVYRAAQKSLVDADLRVAAFLRVVPDPDADLVQEGAAQARDAGAEVVVALGGGSVIDTAKGIAALAPSAATVWDYIDENPNRHSVADALPLLAAPTTAGTGSEVTCVGVFTHWRGQPAVPRKGSIVSDLVRPKVAIVDPNLALSLPARQTAIGAADALGHAIESYLSRRANPFTQALSARAVALILAHLPQALEHPDDIGAREGLAAAATLAGVPLNEAGAVVPHAIAHAMGALLHVPHGLGIALATPVALRFNREACADALAELARGCGIAGGTGAECVERFTAAIIGLLDQAGLLAPFVLPADAPADILDQLVENALASAPIPVKLNPRKVDRAALRAMFEEILGRTFSHPPA